MTMEKAMSEEAQPALTVRDLAAYLSVDEKTIYRLVGRGKLPGFKVAGSWRFRRNDIDEWIEKQKDVTSGQEIS
jgi:excisionase family DNA binding protein